MKLFKTIVPISSSSDFLKAPSHVIRRIDIFKGNDEKSDKVKICFLTENALKNEIHDQLLDGLASACSATEGAEVPEVSFGDLPPKPEEPLLQSIVQIEGPAISVASAIRDAIKHYGLKLNRKYLSEIIEATNDKFPRYDLQQPAEKSSCAIL